MLKSILFLLSFFFLSLVSAQGLEASMRTTDVHVISEVMFPEIQGKQNLSFDYEGYRYQVRVLSIFVIFKMIELPRAERLDLYMSSSSQEANQ